MINDFEQGTWENLARYAEKLAVEFTPETSTYVLSELINAKLKDSIIKELELKDE